MVKSKEELFLAELGIDTKQCVEVIYGGKIKLTELLKKYYVSRLTPLHILEQQKYLDTNKECYKTGGVCEYDCDNFCQRSY